MISEATPFDANTLQAGSRDNDVSKENSKKTFCGYIWSGLSGVGSFLLSPLFGLCHVISKLANSFFSSKETNVNQEQIIFDSHIHPLDPPDLDIPIINTVVNSNLHPIKEIDQNFSPRDMNSQLEGNFNDIVESMDSARSTEPIIKNQPAPAQNSTVVEQIIQAVSEEITDREFDELVETNKIAPQPVVNPGPQVIEIPGLGNCLFMAFAVGLRKQYPDNEKINALLKWDYDPNKLPNNLKGNEHTELLKAPAMHLRQLITVRFEQQFKQLQQQEDLLTALEKHLQEPANQDVQENIQNNELTHLSNLVHFMRLSIMEHNDHVNKEIELRAASFKNNIQRTVKFMNDIQTNNEESGFAKMTLPSTAKRISENIHEFQELCESRIKLSRQFNRADIPEMLKYIKIMERDYNNSGFAEISGLSHEFQVPVNILNQNLEATHNFNSHLEGPPICLLYDAGHFNLVLNPV